MKAFPSTPLSYHHRIVNELSRHHKLITSFLINRMGSRSLLDSSEHVKWIPMQRAALNAYNAPDWVNKLGNSLKQNEYTMSG